MRVNSNGCRNLNLIKLESLSVVSKCHYLYGKTLLSRNMWFLFVFLMDMIHAILNTHDCKRLKTNLKKNINHRQFEQETVKVNLLRYATVHDNV